MIWPVPLAPFKAAIVPVNAEEPEQKAVAEKIYHELQAKGLDPLLDDRIDRIGVKLKDIDLFGIPFKVIVGPKGLKEGKVEVKQRRTGAMELVPLDQVSEKLVQLIGG